MKFDWHNKLSKIIPFALLIGIVFVFVMPYFAHALVPGGTPPPVDSGSQVSNGKCFSFTNFSPSACVSGFFYAIIYIASTLAGIVFAFILWIIEVILQYNMNVVNTTFVQTGFSVTLGLANLGFVLGIIIVALATILRRETYGVKSILWKLIIMAIFVNFALVIAAPIISFGNNLTIFFVNGMSGSSGTNAVTAANPFDNLASGIAGAFQPQRLITPENASTSLAISAVSVGGSILGGIVGLGMALVALVAMCIILIVLMVMLLIRYVYLEVLLVVAPLAWMAWIFPNTSKHFSKWWDRFIKQVFFPAIAMFFIYLVVKIGGNISAAQSVVIVNPNPTGNGWLSGFIQALGAGILSTTIGNVINSIVIIGLMMAGLTMASSLSTEGSKLAATAVGKVRDSVTGYATKQGQKRVRQGFNKAGGGRLVTGMRQGIVGRGLKEGKNTTFMGVPIPGSGLIKKGLGTVLQTETAQRAAGAMGRAAQPYLDNKDLVDEAAKNVPKDSKIILQNLENESMSLEDKFAHIAELQKQGLLKSDTKIGNTNAQDFLDKHADVNRIKAELDPATGKPMIDPKTGKYLEDTDPNAKEVNVGGDGVSRFYGQGKVAFDADRNFLSDKVIRDQRRKIADLTAGTKEYADAITELDAATKKFVTEDLIKGDGKKVAVNGVFAQSDYYTQNLMKNMSQFAPHLISGMLPGAKSRALDNIEDSYQKAIIAENPTTITKENLEDPAWRTDPANKAIADKWHMKAVYGALAGNVLFAVPEEAAAAATPPPPPPAP